MRCVPRGWKPTATPPQPSRSPNRSTSVISQMPAPRSQPVPWAPWTYTASNVASPFPSPPDGAARSSTSPALSRCAWPTTSSSLRTRRSSPWPTPAPSSSSSPSHEAEWMLADAERIGDTGRLPALTARTNKPPAQRRLGLLDAHPAYGSADHELLDLLGALEDV